MRIFVINLKRAKERQENMQKQLQNIPQGFEVEFFSAIDAQKNEHLAFQQYSELKSFLFRGKGLSDGERACFASHYSLWQKCLELNEPIIVLEDDVKMLPNFWQEAQRIDESGYVYVRLMYLFKKGSFFDLLDSFYLSFANIAGSQGYYLTPQGAYAFMQSAQNWYCPVDDYMDMFYIHKVPIVCVEPILQEDTLGMGSTIAGRGAKIPSYLKLLRECTRLYFQLRKFVFMRCQKSRLLLPQNTRQCLENLK